MYKNLGDSLVRYSSNAQSVIILVAPFIKANVIRRLLDVISPELKLQVFTRWIPEEIIIGVSDLEVWQLLKNHPQSNLYLCQNLHAKYYRFDDSCLIGSANLTAQALGWKSSANLEILLPQSFPDGDLRDFENELLTKSFLVDDHLYLEYLELVQSLKKDIPDTFIQLIEPAIFLEKHLWFPLLRNPEELYLAYSDQSSRLTTVARDLAAKELLNFRIAKGFSKETFCLYIALYLKQTKIVKQIDEFLDEPRRFGEIRKLLGNLFNQENIDVNASHTWQTLMRWLLYFLPNRYSYKVFNYSEVFYRIQE